MPPYMFAELEKKIADKRAAGIDVISLGIGDPDHPTYPHVVKAMQEAVADRGNQNYPSNRGREEFRRAFSDFYRDRFGVGIDPDARQRLVEPQVLSAELAGADGEAGAG